jgi:pyruvate kinase
LTSRSSSIGLNIENFVSQIKLGSTLLFDDGIIEAVVKEKQDKMLRIMIVRNSSRKDVLKSDKGVNFPDTVLHENSLTAFDEACLPFILEHADMLGYSFVQRSEDIHYLYSKLTEFGKPEFPVILKIETQSAVNQLPELLLTAMEYGTPGVMIARGDLAVAIGFERLSEIQDEILWICEAAHVPVIWATQVLENLNKSGIATRAEITDAAHASMAECVMINKGENTVKVLKSLKEILNRNGRHHWKKRHMMRKLAIAERYFTAAQ